MYISSYNKPLQSSPKIIRTSEFRRHLDTTLVHFVRRTAHVGNIVLPVIIFAIDCNRLMTMTMQPKAMQTYAAYVSQVFRLVSLRKHRGGKMYARAQALVAPTSSNTTPTSHVTRDKVIADTTREVV